MVLSLLCDIPSVINGFNLSLSVLLGQTFHQLKKQF